MAETGVVKAIGHEWTHTTGEAVYRCNVCGATWPLSTSGESGPCPGRWRDRNAHDKLAAEHQALKDAVVEAASTAREYDRRSFLNKQKYDRTLPEPWVPWWHTDVRTAVDALQKWEVEHADG